LSGIPILSPARPLRHRPCRPFSAAALSALALALQRNRHPVLTSRFRGEKLHFRQSRGHGDIKLIEEVFNAPSFVTIGQELPKICFRKSCAQIAHIGVGAGNSRQHRCWRDAGTSDTRARPSQNRPSIHLWYQHNCLLSPICSRLSTSTLLVSRVQLAYRILKRKDFRHHLSYGPMRSYRV